MNKDTMDVILGPVPQQLGPDKPVSYSITRNKKGEMEKVFVHWDAADDSLYEFTSEAWNELLTAMGKDEGLTDGQIFNNYFSQHDLVDFLGLLRDNNIEHQGYWYGDFYMPGDLSRVK